MYFAVCGLWRSASAEVKNLGFGHVAPAAGRAPEYDILRATGYDGIIRSAVQIVGFVVVSDGRLLPVLTNNN